MPQSSQWFPSSLQLKDPESIERSFRTLLQQFYALQQQHEELKNQVSAPMQKPSGTPPGSGPSDSMLLGLYVKPVDSQKLVDGVKLTWVKASGQFEFI